MKRVLHAGLSIIHIVTSHIQRRYSIHWGPGAVCTCKPRVCVCGGGGLFTLSFQTLFQTWAVRGADVPGWLAFSTCDVFIPMGNTNRASSAQEQNEPPTSVVLAPARCGARGLPSRGGCLHSHTRTKASIMHPCIPTRDKWQSPPLPTRPHPSPPLPTPPHPSTRLLAPSRPSRPSRHAPS